MRVEEGERRSGAGLVQLPPPQAPLELSEGDAVRLAEFISRHLEEILVEWEAFATTLLAPGQVMTSLALRDHATQVLTAIAEDIESDQSDLEQQYKSKGFVQIAEATRTAAMTHGALRHLAGFDLRQLAAEFRALRASVLRL